MLETLLPISGNKYHIHFEVVDSWIPVMMFTSLAYIHNPHVNNSNIVSIFFYPYVDAHRCEYLYFPHKEQRLSWFCFKFWECNLLFELISNTSDSRQAMSVMETHLSVSLQSPWLLSTCYSSFKVASLTAADFSVIKRLIRPISIQTLHRGLIPSSEQPDSV
jgi:hypothetical protein